MDQAFNASDRLWVSQTDFGGANQIEFLRKYSEALVPSSELLDLKPEEEEEVHEKKPYILELGDEFFKELGKLKGKKRKQKHQQQDEEEGNQDADDETPELNNEDPDPPQWNEDPFESSQKKLWEENHIREKNDAKKRAQIKKLTGMNDDELDMMMEESRIDSEAVKRMPFVDKSIVKDGLMPILAPPIPFYFLEQSQALSIYVNFSSDPGEFQWKCRSVNEEVANGLNDVLYKTKSKEAQDKWNSSECRDEFVNENDVVFTVVFYHRSGAYTPNTRLKEPEMAVTIEILGSQTLQDLRCKFYCKNDHIENEIEGNPFETEIPVMTPGRCLKAMEENFDKPCGIFVGNTMHTNKASQEAQDYGESLIHWSKVVGQSRDKLGPFKTASMEETRMVDLKFRHGFPYLFVHQGNCEHLMVIEKGRLVHPHDFLLKADFPSIIKSNFQTVYCQVDNTRIARFVIRNTNWFPQDPMLICPDCLKKCFKQNGERVDNFQLFHFQQISSLF